jgi:type II secretory pathway pseudopilin PulG
MKKSSGVTLIELVIAIIISGFMILSIGLLLIYSQEMWLKASSRSVVSGEALSAQNRISYKLRSATNMPFTFPGGSNWVQFISTDKTVWPPLGTYVKNEMKQRGNTLIYQYWYAHTDAYGNTWYASSVDGTAPEILMSNVQSVNIQPAGSANGGDNNALRFCIEQQMAYANVGSTSSFIVNATTFTVKIRNKW